MLGSRADLGRLLRRRRQKYRSPHDASQKPEGAQTPENAAKCSETLLIVMSICANIVRIQTRRAEPPAFTSSWGARCTRQRTCTVRCAPQRMVFAAVHAAILRDGADAPPQDDGAAVASLPLAAPLRPLAAAFLGCAAQGFGEGAARTLLPLARSRRRHLRPRNVARLAWRGAIGLGAHFVVEPQPPFPKS